MKSMELKAPAKINLALDVLRKRPDGYHDVKMIMQTIDLYDRVHIEEKVDGIEVTASCCPVPSGSANTAYKAAKLLVDLFKIRKGVRIHIEKRIPVSAGLGGGSSDAASVLMGMNKIFSLGLENRELACIGKKVGADVPFFISGGTVLAEGIGELITELDRLADVHIVLVMPKFGVSTAWVYNNLVLEEITEKPDIDLLVKAVCEKRIDTLASNMKNVLEEVTIKSYPIIAEIKSMLLKMGALGSMMSGSGPSVFGIYADKRAAQQAYEKIRNDGWDCYLTHTI